KTQGLGTRLQGDAHAITVGGRLADGAARVRLSLVSQRADRDGGPALPRLMPRQSRGRSVQRVLAMPPRRLAQHGRLAAQVAVVQVVVAQTCDHLMPL